jgi:cell division protein FtsB
MQSNKGFFRDAGPVILRLEQRSARWARLDAGQFRRLSLAVGVLALGLTLLTWGRVRVLANGYQIAELKRERDSLMAEHRRLQSRLEHMHSLQYVEEAARQRLGMVDINPNQVITLRKQTRVEGMLEGVARFFGRRPAPASEAEGER